LIAVALGLVYYFAPDAEQDWVWVTPGALLATSTWLLGSLLFRMYVVSFGNYQATYGALGGVVALLLWMYMTGLVIVTGAEVNAEIEHASPWGKDPGEKVPGERKKIGAAAERAFGQRSSDRQPRPQPPARLPAPVLPATAHASSLREGLLALLLRSIWPRVRRRS
jgi:membrane protein